MKDYNNPIVDKFIEKVNAEIKQYMKPTYQI